MGYNNWNCNSFVVNRLVNFLHIKVAAKMLD